MRYGITIDTALFTDSLPFDTDAGERGTEGGFALPRPPQGLILKSVAMLALVGEIGLVRRLGG